MSDQLGAERGCGQDEFVARSVRILSGRIIFVTRWNMEPNPQDPESQPHTGILQPARRRVLRRHAQSRRQSNVTALLQYIKNDAFYDTRFGCGPAATSRCCELGPRRLVWKASRFSPTWRGAHSGCEVWQQDFLKLDLPDNHFDGISPTPRFFMCQAKHTERIVGTHAS